MKYFHSFGLKVWMYRIFSCYTTHICIIPMAYKRIIYVCRLLLFFLLSNIWLHVSGTIIFGSMSGKLVQNRRRISFVFNIFSYTRNGVDFLFQYQPTSINYITSDNYVISKYYIYGNINQYFEMMKRGASGQYKYAE